MEIIFSIELIPLSVLINLAVVFLVCLFALIFVIFIYERDRKLQNEFRSLQLPPLLKFMRSFSQTWFDADTIHDLWHMSIPKTTSSEKFRYITFEKLDELYRQGILDHQIKIVNEKRVHQYKLRK